MGVFIFILPERDFLKPRDGLSKKIWRGGRLQATRRLVHFLEVMETFVFYTERDVLKPLNDMSKQIWRGGRLQATRRLVQKKWSFGILKMGHIT